METNDRTIVEIARGEDAPKEQLFDELSRGVADGTISRGRALKLAGTALLAALFGSVATDEAEAVPERRCERRPAITNRRCPARGVCRDRPDQTCSCARTVEGDRRCVDLTNEVCPTTDECDRSRDCPGNEYCIQVGGCCGRLGRNLCVRPCD